MAPSTLPTGEKAESYQGVLTEVLTKRRRGVAVRGWLCHSGRRGDQEPTDFWQQHATVSRSAHSRGRHNRHALYTGFGAKYVHAGHLRRCDGYPTTTARVHHLSLLCRVRTCREKLSFVIETKPVHKKYPFFQTSFHIHN